MEARMKLEMRGVRKRREKKKKRDLCGKV